MCLAKLSSHGGAPQQSNGASQQSSSASAASFSRLIPQHPQGGAQFGRGGQYGGLSHGRPGGNATNQSNQTVNLNQNFNFGGFGGFGGGQFNPVPQPGGWHQQQAGRPEPQRPTWPSQNQTADRPSHGNWQRPAWPGRPEVCAKPPKPEVCAKPPKPEVCAKPPKPEVCAKPPKPEVCAKPPKPECPPEKPIAVTQGKIWGDPHFIGADGGKYDVQGEAGKTYNLLSDKGLQVNGEFQGHGGATIVGNLGITDGQNQVAIDKTGKLTINGEVITKDGTYGNDDIGSVVKTGDTFTVKSGEYTMKVTAQGKSYLDIEFKSPNAVADNVKPHGLWGVSVDGDGVARNGDGGGSAQGGGAIETADGTITQKGDKTTVKQYEVAGLFDTKFDNFTNKFYG